MNIKNKIIITGILFVQSMGSFIMPAVSDTDGWSAPDWSIDFNELGYEELLETYNAAYEDYLAAVEAYRGTIHEIRMAKMELRSWCPARCAEPACGYAVYKSSWGRDKACDYPSDAEVAACEATCRVDYALTMAELNEDLADYKREYEMKKDICERIAILLMLKFFGSL